MLNPRLKNKKGNSSIEYAFLIAVVIGALIGMQAYLKRPVCQRWRLAGDAFGFGRQYGMVEAPNPPEPPEPINLVQVGILNYDRSPIVGLPVGGISMVSLTAGQVEMYYTPLLELDWNDPLELTSPEFMFLFGRSLTIRTTPPIGTYWIYWREEQAPNILIERTLRIVSG